MLFAQAPAWAHHKDGHESGPSEEAAEQEEAASEETGEDGNTSEARSEDTDEGDDAAGDSADGSGDGWSSYRTRSADREREATTSTTTSSSSGTQECDGSHHSDSGDGANRSGPDNPYQNTCEPEHRPGNGQGKARPCAGCVGNADDKFPPGQEPDWTDHNNGYECDGNNGIAKENPAHTGCKDAPPPPPSVCDANPTTPMIEPCISGNPPNPPIPPGQPPGPPRTDIVLPRPPIRFNPNPPDVVLDRPPGLLPVTGTGPLGFLVLGLSMIATGAGALRSTRSRRGSRRKV